MAAISLPEGEVFVNGKYGVHYIPVKDIFNFSAKAEGFVDNQNTVSIELKVTPKVNYLRERAKILVMIADQLEKNYPAGGSS